MVNQEQMEKAEAALNQLMTCAKADCGCCGLVPEPSKYSECLQVMQTCEEILRETCGLPERSDDGTQTE